MCVVEVVKQTPQKNSIDIIISYTLIFLYKSDLKKKWFKPHREGVNCPFKSKLDFINDFELKF